MPFNAALPPEVTFDTLSGWLKSMPPAIEKPHGAPPDSVTVNDAIFLFLLSLSEDSKAVQVTRKKDE